MERLCFILHLVPGMEAEYERRHDEIWHDMQAAVVEAGFRNYTLFRRGTQVIGYAECVPDIATVLLKEGAAEVNSLWEESLSHVIATMTDETGGPITCTEVWHLDESDS